MEQMNLDSDHSIREVQTDGQSDERMDRWKNRQKDGDYFVMLLTSLQKGGEDMNPRWYGTIFTRWSAT